MVACRPSLASVSAFGAQLSTDIMLAQAMIKDCILIKGSDPVFEATSPTPDHQPSWRLVITPTDLRLLNGETSIEYGRFPQGTFEILRAPLELRDADQFVEVASDDMDTSRRRRAWTAACLGASMLLP